MRKTLILTCAAFALTTQMFVNCGQLAPEFTVADMASTTLPINHPEEAVIEPDITHNVVGRDYVETLFREIFTSPRFATPRVNDVIFYWVTSRPASYGMPCDLYSSYSQSDCGGDADISKGPPAIEASTLREAYKNRACQEILTDDNAVRAAMEKVLKRKLYWSYAGPLAGLTCVAWNEPNDPHTWGDNFLCYDPTDLPSQIRFNSAGPISGMNCTALLETSDTAGGWNDNYLCSQDDHGFRWSSAGAASAELTPMECAQILEPAEPTETTWTDNFLCLPQSREPDADNLGRLYSTFRRGWDPDPEYVKALLSLDQNLQKKNLPLIDRWRMLLLMACEDTFWEAL